MSSTWSEEAERKKERKERLKVRNEKLAGYFFDLSKLSFAGLVIGVPVSVISQETNVESMILMTTGIIFTTIFLTIANKFLK